LRVETVVLNACWWRGVASSVAGDQDPVMRHLGVTGTLL